jgi:3-hydroxy-9,10-secoandrosta-1,3,5(10)-triene-9,17-dione monooxygenase
VTRVPSTTELVQRATALLPALRERAARCEQLRQIPPESVKDLVASGLIRTGNPVRYGGNGADLDAAHAVAFELGRACGSTAWCASLWMVHNWWLGHFSLRAQEDFFATGPDTLSSTCLNPAGGRAEPVPGGFRVSGRWSFSSGCDAADWIMVATPAPAPAALRWLLLPRPDCTVVDTWFASGMRGSGSKDVAVQDVFVPEHRALDPDQAGESDRTGWELHQRPSYRAPLRILTGWDLAAPLVGIAQGAVDDFTRRLRAGAPSGPAQLRLAKASAEVDAARTLHAHAVREVIDRAGVGETFTEADRARYRRDKAFVARLCVQAVNRLFEAGGARAIMESEALQRFHRDAHAASHHAALAWDVAAEAFGRLAMSGDSTAAIRPD